jgi:succinylarginine dihydrolase
MLEVNFDGLVGPSHNYAGLSLGNIASATHAGAVSARARRRCRVWPRCGG